MQFVACYWKYSGIVLLSDYAYNPTFQEFTKINKCFQYGDEKMFINLRRGMGYTGELEKINRNDSDLIVTVTLKAASTKI